LLGCLVLSSLACAQGEVRVFAGGAVTGIAQQAGEALAPESGHSVVVISDTTGSLVRRLESEVADVMFVSAPAIDALEEASRLVPGTRVDVARALIGVGVRAGAPSPDLSTEETFRAALLEARSVSYVNPAAGGTSGTYFEGLLGRMGIADAMASKIVYRTQGSEVADAVARGDAELGITFTSELQTNPGVRVAGTLPAAIQLPTIYSAAMMVTAENSVGARAFLSALASAEGRAAVTAAGLEPIGPAR
jgi:molybdate transport system substrate-binding protein